MIEHVSIPVSDYKRATKFYSAALKPLGYTLYRKYPPSAAGYMEGGSTSVWTVVQGKKVQPMHIALGAKSKKAVEEFYKKGLKAGGKDNGGPGFRLDYGDDYYAAFLLDTDGNNIEACYFGAKAPKQKKK
ncbi:MAG TPA: VOC family protein [Candidatus Paceibacterota bacterium]|nr:VOC family protein [Candidatus Paceibacterota bacterium]